MVFSGELSRLTGCASVGGDVNEPVLVCSQQPFKRRNRLLDCAEAADYESRQEFDKRSRLLDLIFHQGNQRRDYQSEAREMEGSNLEDQ